MKYFEQIMHNISKICLELHGAQEVIDETVDFLKEKGFTTEQNLTAPVCVAFFRRENS